MTLPHPRLRSRILVLAAVSLAIAACTSNGGAAASPRGGRTSSATTTRPLPEANRPAEVPSSAVRVTSALDLGDAASTTGAPIEALDIMYAFSCRDGLVTIATTRETLYAERPCERVPPDEAFRTYLSRPVLIRISGGDLQQLSLNTDTVGGLGFSASRIWLLCMEAVWAAPRKFKPFCGICLRTSAQRCVPRRP